ncbi:MAG: flagellar hook-associated protein FlgK [Cellulosilyticaceae bacterium]
MSSIASLGRMVSGLSASQRGLQVTGHNLSNVNTPGYTRQQLVQGDSRYHKIGAGGYGLKQVGLGVDVLEVRQIRDSFADKRFRTENSALGFYAGKQNATAEVEAILDEPHGEALSKMLNDFWRQTQKLSTSPEGVEERLAFIQTANVIIKKANHMMESFTNYQEHLNNQVKQGITDVNKILKGIKDLNNTIAEKEIGGDNANDLRDQRNNLLDELSGYIGIDYYEEPSGRVVVKGEGRTLVDGQFVVEMQMKVVDATPSHGFVKPVWSDTNEDVFKLNEEINSATQTDAGKLKALLIARGEAPGNKDTDWKDIALNDNKSVDYDGNSYMIPKLQKKLDEFITTLVDTVNDAFDGFGIGEYADEKGVPIFVEIKAGKGLVAGNVQVNPLLLENGGYNRLGTVSPDAGNPAETSGNVGDNKLIVKLLDEWLQPREWFNKDPGNPANPHKKTNNFMDFYAEYVADVGREGYSYKGKVKEKNTMVINSDNERQAIGGVSQDEELSNMLKYQYAYNASSRMITILDGMMDTVINKM